MRTALHALLILVGVVLSALQAAPANAQGPGLYIARAGTGRPACTSITNPAPGLTWCHDGNDLALKVWSGSSYVGGGFAGVGSLNGLAGALAIQGTPNQVLVSALGSTIGLSLPQSIALSSSPSFAGLTLTDIAPASTECLQISSLGALSTSGATCGGGGGAGVSAINSLTGGLTLVGVANRTTVTSVGATLTVTLPNAVSGLTSLSATSLVGLTSITGPVRDKAGQVFNIEAYGASTAGTAADNTTNMMLAATACDAAGGGFIYVPPGEYSHNAMAFTAAHSGCTWVGAGVSASRLRFVPTANNQTAWSFTLVVEGGIRDLTIYTTDAAFTKTAVSLVNTDKFLIDRVTLGYAGSNWTGANSVGLRTDGHNYTRGEFLFVYADRPIVHAGNVTSDFGNDMYVFRHLQLHANGHPNIEVLANATVGSYTIDGTNDWAGGTDGFKWIQTSGSFALGVLSFNNIRWEQPEGTAGFFFNIEAMAGRTTQMVTFNNVSHGAGVSAPGGFRFRRLSWATIKNYRAIAIETRAVLNIDSTVDTLTLENFVTASATPTFTVSGQSINYDASNADSSIIAYRIYQPTATRLPLVLARQALVNTTAGVAQLSVLGSGYFGPGGATDDGLWPLRVVGPLSKTSATPQALLFVGSNDAALALGFAVAIVGGAVQADRYVSFSADNGGGSGGSLIFNNSGGNVGIGTIAPAVRLDVRDRVIISPNTATLPAMPSGGVLQISNVNANPAYVTLDTFGNQSAILLRRANGTPGARTPLVAGNLIGGLVALGAYDATNYSDPSLGGSAGIGFYADTTLPATPAWSAGSRPTYMTFGTTPSGFTTIIERMRIAADGSISAVRSGVASTPLHGLTATLTGSRSGLGSVLIPAMYGPNPPGPLAWTLAPGGSIVVSDSSTWTPPCSAADTPPGCDATTNQGVSSSAFIVKHTFLPGYTSFGIAQATYAETQRNTLAVGLTDNDTYAGLDFLLDNNVVTSNVVARYSQLTVNGTQSGLKAAGVFILSNHGNRQPDRHGISIGSGDIADTTTSYTAEAAINIGALAPNGAGAYTVEAWQKAIKYADRFAVLGSGAVVANVPLGFVGQILELGMGGVSKFRVSESGDIGGLTLTIDGFAGLGANRTVCSNNGVLYTVASGAAC